MSNLKTIRYMGNKTSLIEYIEEQIRNVTPTNGIVCDLMAGSGVVAYALKEHYKIVYNDVQYYSYVIGKAIVKNDVYKPTITEVEEFILKLKPSKNNFFEKTYSDTYFSKQQCVDIDSIRFNIEYIHNEYKKNLYLLILMGAMNSVQSTSGHYAQFMDKENTRIQNLRKKDIKKEFIKRSKEYIDLKLYNNGVELYNLDFNDLLAISPKIDTIYLDSPYTQEQYSRFYHILETVCKNDNPLVNYKAKYREQRFQSKFSSKPNAKNEFEKIFKYCNEKRINLVISYSNKSIVPIKELEKLASIYFSNYIINYIDYKHSTQGKGIKEVNEVLITCIV